MQVSILVLPIYIQVYLEEVAIRVHVNQSILSSRDIRYLRSIGVCAVNDNLEVCQCVAQVGGAAAHHAVAEAAIDSWRRGERRMDGQSCRCEDDGRYGIPEACCADLLIGL